MKKTKLIRASFTPVTNGKMYENLKNSFLITKYEKDNFLMQYPSPRYLCDFELLKWSELDNCNFIEKIIYKINIPKWVMSAIGAILLVILGAYLNSKFGN